MSMYVMTVSPFRPTSQPRTRLSVSRIRPVRGYEIFRKAVFKGAPSGLLPSSFSTSVMTATPPSRDPLYALCLRCRLSTLVFGCTMPVLLRVVFCLCVYFLCHDTFVLFVFMLLLSRINVLLYKVGEG